MSSILNLKKKNRPICPIHGSAAALLPAQGILTSLVFEEAASKYPLDMSRDEFFGVVDDAILGVEELAHGIFKGEEGRVRELILSDHTDSRETIPDMAANLEIDFYSLKQGAKSRAGSVFEAIGNWICSRAGLEILTQFKVPGGAKKLDIYIPKINLAVALKRTLKERWTQALPEVPHGKSLFMLSMDRDVSELQIKQMRGLNVVLVLPELIIEERGLGGLANVWTYKMFLDMAANMGQGNEAA